MDSVLNLKVTKSVYNLIHPYKDPSIKEVSGSGFIIDIQKGLIVTNAEIVLNAITITGFLNKTGKKDLSLEIVGICKEKDLAICKISDISIINDITKLNLKFGDSMNVNIGDKVFSLGKTFSKGIISGNEFQIEDKEELTRYPICFSTNIYTDVENSGGPLLNKNNEVIGINKVINNINYAIPSRTFLAIYSKLLQGIVKTPSLSLDWCKTNREIMKKQTGSSSTYGIYVRKVYPGSCLDSLEKGDIIRRIDYVDLFWKPNGQINQEIFDLNDTDLEKNLEKGTLVTVFLDRFGMSNKIVKLKNPEELDEMKIEFETVFTDKVLSLSQIMDMVPIGANLILNISRNRNWYKLKTQYVSIESERLSYIYSKIDYEIFAGLCLTNLTSNHLSDNLFDINHLSNNDELKYKKSVIITQVFPGSSAYKTQILKPGHIIKSLLGFDTNFELVKETHCVISTLEDIRHILKLNPEYIQITTTDNSTFLFSLNTIIKEDQNILKVFSI